jgi:DNA-binding LacI/PurR family transcriptional regulator
MGWLAEAGIRVPEDLSIISFDNVPRASQNGITSVDFGYGYIGYAAFHTFLGLMPVRRTRQGDISARPFVSQRLTLRPAL